MKDQISRRSFLRKAGSTLLAPLIMGGLALAQSGSGDIVRIGIVLPVPTGTYAPTDVVGEAARYGAILADRTLGAAAAERGVRLEMMYASSPTAEAATRAAERLVNIDGVSALVGGLGDGQAEALSAVAETLQVPFFDVGTSIVGAPDMTGRSFTFNIEATATDYLDVTTEWFASQDAHNWVILTEETDTGAALAELAKASIEAHGMTVVSTVRVEPDTWVYSPALDEITAALPDVVLNLLPASRQEFFQSQYESFGPDAPMTGLPDAVSQTRDFYGQLLRSAPRSGAGYRAALWETTIDEGMAGELNQAFIGQFGRPMNPSAWAAYAAVKIAFDALTTGDRPTGAALRDHLTGLDVSFDVGKGTDVRFDPGSNQLIQPLFIVQLDSSGSLGSLLADQLEMAHLAE